MGKDYMVVLRDTNIPHLRCSRVSCLPFTHGHRCAATMGYGDVAPPVLFAFCYILISGSWILEIITSYRMPQFWSLLIVTCNGSNMIDVLIAIFPAEASLLQSIRLKKCPDHCRVRTQPRFGRHIRSPKGLRSDSVG